MLNRWSAPILKFLIVLGYLLTCLLSHHRKEVRKHGTRDSCWVIIQDNAYDITEIIDSHPGGSNPILRYAAKDATRAFVPIHASDALLKHISPQYVPECQSGAKHLMMT